MSEDELQLAAKETPKPRRRSKAAPSQDGEEVKMETRKKESTKGPRRSLRGKDHILQSDTMKDELAASPAKKKATPRRLKPDTARQRLRDDIASQTRAKGNNFLVAHKDYFLPLLPPNNHVSKLTANAPIVEYEELTEQPKG